MGKSSSRGEYVWVCIQMSSRSNEADTVRDRAVAELQCCLWNDRVKHASFPHRTMQRTISCGESPNTWPAQFARFWISTAPRVISRFPRHYRPFFHEGDSKIQPAASDLHDPSYPTTASPRSRLAQQHPTDHPSPAWTPRRFPLNPSNATLPPLSHTRGLSRIQSQDLHGRAFPSPPTILQIGHTSLPAHDLDTPRTGDEGLSKSAWFPRRD